MFTTKKNNSNKNKLQDKILPIEYIAEVSKTTTFPEAWSGFPISGYFYQRRAS